MVYDKDGVWRRRQRRRRQDTEPKTRTPHNDVGKKCISEQGTLLDPKLAASHGTLAPGLCSLTAGSLQTQRHVSPKAVEICLCLGREKDQY